MNPFGILKNHSLETIIYIIVIFYLYILLNVLNLILYLYNLGDSQSIDLMNLLMREKIASENEDSILCHAVSSEDENISENEELSISIMQLNEKYLSF